MGQKIYIAVNKNGVPFMFVNEPTRTVNSWIGNFYVNSVLYPQVCQIAKQAGLKFENDPELIEFQIKT